MKCYARRHGEGLGIEEFVPAERTDGLTKERDGASHDAWSTLRSTACIRAKSGGIVVVPT